ncbi:MAG: ATP-binding cassette domain-containing protein [Candidatus Coproplasma sp.]
MLINLSEVGFSYGDNLIFDGVSFSVNEGEKVGLIGANGEGKTTLIKLMLGEYVPENGTVTVKNGAKFGYLEQNGGYDSGSTVYGEMLAVFKEELAAVARVEELSQKLAECDYSSKEYAILSAKLEAAQKFVAARDCYNIDVKIKSVLNGMGFADFYDRVIDTMSGGEKTRLKLARLLLEEPDLLILDEPTNHLDIRTLFWLEDYLKDFKGAVFIVSHDRYFLDKLVSRTLEIENKKLSSFSGNYSKYKILKAERVALALKEYEKQQEEIQKLQTYVDKNIVRATTAKSAQSRVKQLERMELKEKPYLPPKPPEFSFTYTQPPYERVLTVKNLHLTAGDKTLVENGEFLVLRGQKIAIVGENGAGKSTLLKHLTQGGDAAIEVGRYVKFSLYDQENANLNPDNTVLQELWERHVAYSQTEARASLARSGLFAEDMEKKVGDLSGGERAKLALCVFSNECGNVLVLDEPTNHLDLPARESLERALRAFDGTVIFVSHDRYFITAVADTVLEIENKKIAVYPGGYEGYKAEKDAAARAELERERIAAMEKRDEERRSSYRSKKERAEEARIKARIKEIEADIYRNEREEAELNSRLSDPGITSDFKKLNQVMAELEEIKKSLDALYAEYEKLI